MKNPRKTVIPITENELPEPFKTIWFSLNHMGEPKYKFLLIDGEVYMYGSHENSRFVKHWTDSPHISLRKFVQDNGLLQNLPMVTRDGEYLFQLEYGFWEINAVFEDGSKEVVYDG
jgi:hypothetical protein